MSFKSQLADQFRRKRLYTWYIRLEGGDDGNRIIADLPGVDRYNDFGEVVCFDGKQEMRCLLWKMPTIISVNAFKKFARENGIRFSLYVKEGEGKVRFSWIGNSQKKKHKLHS